MSSWVTFPDCLTIDVDVEETFRIPDPLWPGLGFAIAFIIGGIIGALLARMCLRDYMKMKSQDAEKATLIAQGIPLHMRGRKSVFPTPTYSDTETLKPSEMDSPAMGRMTSPRAGATTPSSITLDADTTSGLSDALIKPTGDSAVAEISHQDVSYFLLLEEQMRTERVEGLLYLVRIHLNKLVVSNKLSDEDAERVVSGLKKKCADIIERNSSSEKAAIAAVTNNPKMQQNSVAMQTEIDRLHSSCVQKTNWDLSTVESDIPHLLASVEGLSDEDIDGLMKKLKHQLATREHKVNDETRRQVQSLEERLARRRELAEQNRLHKQATADLVNTKLEKRRDGLQLLVNNSTLTEMEKDRIMEQYEKELWTVHNNNEQERAEQEQLLHEKLAKRRRNRLKKLATQQSKAKNELHGKFVKSSSHSDINEYDEYMEQLHDEFAQAIAELDEDEAKQLNGAAVTAGKEFAEELENVDNQLNDTLANNPSIDDDTVNKLIKIHKAEMKEYNITKQNERQRMEAKLQQKLAERKQQREESAKESQVAFQSIKVQQEELVHKVLQNQADLTEEAAARIMEEHKRNMETINSQLSISKIRQEKQLEERLAQRRARLAEKEQERQQAGAAKAEKLQLELEEERQRIRKDHERELEALKNNLQEETQQALNAQELQISQMIGQLEVGQARRKNILQKQDKLISELENQLANKMTKSVGDNPKGYTTTTELMQKHYGQVEALNNTLQTTRERQEQALQEKLEQKRLMRESEIREQMKAEAHKEMENMRARGAGAASDILVDMMLQQRHERAMEELEKEMKVEMQRSRDQMNEELHAEMMAALSDEGKNFMAEMAVNSGLSNTDLTEAMENAAKSIQANDQTVKKLAKEMKVRVKTAKGERTAPRPRLTSEDMSPVDVHNASRNLMKQLRMQQMDLDVPY